MTDVTVTFQGWGRAGWGEQAFGEGSSSLGNRLVGSVTVQANADVVVTGLLATTALGVTTQTGTAVLVPGVVGTSAVGTLLLRRCFVLGYWSPRYFCSW
jgi:hypothetical protein